MENTTETNKFDLIETREEEENYMQIADDEKRTTTVEIVGLNETPTEAICDFPPYSNGQMFMNVFSILVFLLDIVTDVLLALSYYKHGQWTYFRFTVVFMTVPSLVMNGFSFVRFIADTRRQNMKKERLQGTTPVLGLIVGTALHTTFSILQLGPVVRYSSAIYYGVKSRNPDSGKGSVLYMKCRDEERLSRQLRLFETAMEAGPQLILQLYVLLTFSYHGGLSNFKQIALCVASILTSWVGISWAHVSYYRAAIHVHDGRLTTTGTVVYFLWRLTEIGPRVLSFSVFAEVLTYHVFVIIGVHWLAMFVWYMSTRRVAFDCIFVYANVSLLLNNMASAAVSTFGFLDIRNGRSRYHYAVYYLIFYVENITMVGVWFALTTNRDKWFQIPILVFIVFGLLVSISSQIVYYLCYHTHVHNTK